jgi:uncharacterized protein (DUF302 family)
MALGTSRDRVMFGAQVDAHRVGVAPDAERRTSGRPPNGRILPKRVRGVTTHRCRGTFDQVLRRLVAAVERADASVVEVIDHSGEAFEAGIALPETKLLFIGHRADTADMVESAPIAALELPLRVLLREDSDGSVSISYPELDDLVARYGLSGRSVLRLRALGRTFEAVAGRDVEER